MATDEPQRVLKLNDLFQISGWQHKLPWKPFQPGVDIYRLYGDGENGPTAALLRFRAGGRVRDLGLPGRHDLAGRACVAAKAC